MITDTDPRVAEAIRLASHGDLATLGVYLTTLLAKVPSAPVEAVPQFDGAQDSAEGVARHFEPVLVARWFLHEKHWRIHNERELVFCESRIANQRKEITRLQNAATAVSIMTPAGKTENEINRLETEVARLTAELQEVRTGAPANDWRLPGDFTCRGATFRKGVHVRTILGRMERLYDAAYPGFAELTPKQQSANLALLQSAAACDVLAERARQIGAEGWTSEHDDGRGPGVLAEAGACYAMAFPNQPMPMDWPWEVNWWKPKDRRSNLVRAAALVLAEIERFDRVASPEATNGSL